jgi:hypothetical protein
MKKGKNKPIQEGLIGICTCSAENPCLKLLPMKSLIFSCLFTPHAQYQAAGAA